MSHTATTRPQNASGTEPGQQQDDLTRATPLQHKKSKEIGGQKGPEPTRFGDWEKNGRCTDF